MVETHTKAKGGCIGTLHQRNNDLGEQVAVKGMAYSGTSYQVAAAAAVVEIEVALIVAAQVGSDERDIWDRTIGAGCLSRRSTRGLVGHFAVGPSRWGQILKITANAWQILSYRVNRGKSSESN